MGVIHGAEIQVCFIFFHNVLSRIVLAYSEQLSVSRQSRYAFWNVSLLSWGNLRICFGLVLNIKTDIEPNQSGNTKIHWPKYVRMNTAKFYERPVTFFCRYTVDVVVVFSIIFWLVVFSGSLECRWTTQCSSLKTNSSLPKLSWDIGQTSQKPGKTALRCFCIRWLS